MNLHETFIHWDQVHADTLDTVDKFSEKDLKFLPFRKSWSAGQIMLHIANAEEGWFRHVVTHELADWPAEYDPAAFNTPGKIKAHLDTVHELTCRYLESVDVDGLEKTVTAPWGAELSLRWITWHVIEHEIHHRGELSLILGMLGREGLDV
jgi:uncharacterized damage-inducible protein DinB